MNPDWLKATGAFMAIVGLALIGSTLGFGLATVHIANTAPCVIEQDLCKALVNPMQVASGVAFVGGAVMCVSGAYAYTQAGEE